MTPRLHSTLVSTPFASITASSKEQDQGSVEYDLAQFFAEAAPEHGGRSAPLFEKRRCSSLSSLVEHYCGATLKSTVFELAPPVRTKT